LLFRTRRTCSRDAAAIALYAVTRQAWPTRPPKGGYNLRAKRAEILSAQCNGITRVVLSGLAWLQRDHAGWSHAPEPVAGVIGGSPSRWPALR